METVALQKKRKNIDLPVETLQKLSIMAASQGKSLKAFIESLLVAKANAVCVEVSTNPSPSGDGWFDDLIIWHLLCVVLRMQNKEGLKHIQ